MFKNTHSVPHVERQDIDPEEIVAVIGAVGEIEVQELGAGTGLGDALREIAMDGCRSDRLETVSAGVEEIRKFGGMILPVLFHLPTHTVLVVLIDVRDAET
jgi:hypothetical protein